MCERESPLSGSSWLLCTNVLVLVCVRVSCVVVGASKISLHTKPTPRDDQRHGHSGKAPPLTATQMLTSGALEEANAEGGASWVSPSSFARDVWLVSPGELPRLY